MTGNMQTHRPLEGRNVLIVEDEPVAAETLREYRALVSKRAALAAEKTDAELAGSEAYADLEDRIESLRGEVDAANEHLLDDDAFLSLLRDLTDEGGDEGAW